MRDVPCPVCEGTRLKPEILAVTLAAGERGAKSIAEVCELSDLRLRRLPQRAHAGPTRAGDRRAGAQGNPVAAAASCSTSGWSTCRCPAPRRTLSGGEAQRIRLATQIGSGLVGVLYVLDEPSIGLHQRDNRRLIETLTRLRDLGNTLIVVEHDEDTIAHADWIVDIGPGAGEHGGQHRAQRDLRRAAGQQGLDHRRLPVGQGEHRDPGDAASRRPASVSSRSSAPASTTCAASTCRSRSACSPR